MRRLWLGTCLPMAHQAISCPLPIESSAREHISAHASAESTDRLVFCCINIHLAPSHCPHSAANSLEPPPFLGGSPHVHCLQWLTHTPSSHVSIDLNSTRCPCAPCPPNEQYDSNSPTPGRSTPSPSYREPIVPSAVEPSPVKTSTWTRSCRLGARFGSLYSAAQNTKSPARSSPGSQSQTQKQTHQQKQ